MIERDNELKQETETRWRSRERSARYERRNLTFLFERIQHYHNIKSSFFFSFLQSLLLVLQHLITLRFSLSLSFSPLRRTDRLHGPRLLHPEPVSEQPAVPRLPGPSPGHPAEPHVPAPRPLLLRPGQDAGGTRQHPHPPRGEPLQLQVRPHKHRLLRSSFRVKLVN